MLQELKPEEAYLSFCLAVASQDNELNEKERLPIIKGMKDAGLLSSEYDLKRIFHSTIEKISPIFKDGEAFNFDEENLKVFASRIKSALNEEGVNNLFLTAIDVALADGIFEFETEMVFLDKMHSLLGIKRDLKKIIEERST